MLAAEYRHDRHAIIVNRDAGRTPTADVPRALLLLPLPLLECRPITCTGVYQGRWEMEIMAFASRGGWQLAESKTKRTHSVTVKRPTPTTVVLDRTLTSRVRSWPLLDLKVISPDRTSLCPAGSQPRARLLDLLRDDRSFARCLIGAVAGPSWLALSAVNSIFLLLFSFLCFPASSIIWIRV
ncbi:hypothetical protein X777_00923 [Ooceraea biroi]|uniref:Uncharacterized protein n=1 Tax=Ooceraea biroi TaxID=2015173 RepID=A0A026WQ49_OOCBI|nr:hypothetical protein X777_00923 [Ooceraea biroi]